ncbi:MAG: electron transfer flavoprotein subunit beta/FixA family protein [Actinobacteria bacterium]|nr:electron transfer flavoprotein subunit beta/FixA family protein [Actinomycetota bacterium]
MKIVVMVKEVPDTYGTRTLDLGTGLSERLRSEPVLDEIGERAIEAALAYRERGHNAEIIVVSMGPRTTTATLQKALAMGADSAVHIVDDALIGADLLLTAEVLASAVRKIGDVDLVLAGDQSSDGSAGIVPAMMSELLGWPNATGLSSLSLTDSALTGMRVSDSANVSIEADLPAVASITETFPEARFPTFAGIIAAKRKSVAKWSLAEMGWVPATEVARSIMVDVSARPARIAGTTIHDSGDAGTQLARFLIEKGLV